MKRLIYSLIPLLCAACAMPHVQDERPAVQEPQLEQHVFVTSDKTELPVRVWSPEQKSKPKAVIVGIHGFNDYSHAFELPGEYMRARGVTVIAYDQRGFGRAVHPGLWPGTDNLTRDAADMVRAAKLRYPHTPVYLLGESMGGAVAIAAAVRPDFPAIDGLILSAPALWGGETLNPFYRATLWTFAHLWPKKVMTGEDLHILASDNIAMLRALGGDPYVIKATRVDAIYGLVQLMDTAYGDIGKVKVPMLILYGAHDQVIPSEPILRSLRHINADSRGAYYPLGYHMLLRDLHGDVPVRDILSWIGDKKRPLPSGYEVNMKQFMKKHWSAHPPATTRHVGGVPYQG